MSERSEEVIRAAFISMLAEGVAILLFLLMLTVWMAIGATRADAQTVCPPDCLPGSGITMGPVTVTIPDDRQDIVIIQGDDVKLIRSIPLCQSTATALRRSRDVTNVRCFK